MTAPIEVILTPAELMMAATSGALRQAESMLSGRKEAHGAPDTDDALWKHVLGACGEIAIARVLSRYWGGDVNTFKKADIGKRVQIRMRSRHDRELLVRPDDDPNMAYVHVTGTPTQMLVHGWCWGWEAMTPEYLKPHGGRPEAYFVPTTVLRSLLREGVE